MINVWTGGTFDCLHPGHVHLFKMCDSLTRHGGKVTVAVNSDEFVEAYKGTHTVQNLNDRVTMVAAMKFVDEVQINMGGYTQADLILKSGADIIVIGDDWQDRDYHAQLGITQRWLEENNITIEYVKRVGDFSSTEFKRTIRERP